MKKSIFCLVLCCGALYYGFFTQILSSYKDGKMKLMSTAFNNGDQLPKKYTCDGQGVNPPLNWANIPEGTKSLVLLMDDPDAPATKPEPWVHWIVFNIPPTLNHLDENVNLSTIKGAKQGLTNSGKSMYHGACPPDGVHRYRFFLYALNDTLDLPEGVSRKDLEREMKKVGILGQAHLIATYERK